MLLAVLDGINNKIHPGEAQDIDLFEAEYVAKRLPSLSSSLCEAMKALESNHDYLTNSGVFSKELIQIHLEMKWQECNKLAKHPHLLEFDLYYNP